MDLPNCFSRGTIPEFLRKPIATCDFPGDGVGPDPLPPIQMGIRLECIQVLMLSLFSASPLRQSSRKP